MSNEEFLRVLEEVSKSITTIMLKCHYKEHEKRRKSLRKISEAIDFFHFKVTPTGILDVYYDNYILSIGGRYKQEDQRVVLPLMILYTNISYSVLKAKKNVTKQTYEKLCVEKQKIGNAIRQMCVKEFQDCVVTKRNLKNVANFLKWSIPQLYHCIGEIGEYSERVEPKDARKLSKIRATYKSFKVGTKYVYYHDEITEEDRKIPIDSPETAYAVCMLFCECYTTSLIWLKEYDPSGQWCPIVPWNIINKFTGMMCKLF